MQIRLREPKDTCIENAKGSEATWTGGGVLIHDAHLSAGADTIPLGKQVFVPYENIAYVVVKP